MTTRLVGSWVNGTFQDKIHRGGKKGLNGISTAHIQIQEILDQNKKLPQLHVIVRVP